MNSQDGSFFKNDKIFATDRSVSDIQTLAFGPSLYLKYRSAAHILSASTYKSYLSAICGSKEF
jgi:hypothetical protein